MKKESANWIDEAISVWTANGIKLQEGISADKIQEFEKRLNFVFPEDFIDFYLKVNGFEDYEWNTDTCSLWSLERILKEYEEDGGTNFVGFCDYMIHSYTFDFNKSDKRIYKSFHPPVMIADNFRDFISLLNSNDDLLY